MELDFEDEVTGRLRQYAALVADALGLHGDSSCVELEHPCSVYLAIDGRLPRFPDDDLALVWTERRGWCAVTESPGGGRLREVARLDGRVNAAPRAVAAWVRGLLADRLSRSA
jgi:uncharacterized protein DUF6292